MRASHCLFRRLFHFAFYHFRHSYIGCLDWREANIANTVHCISDFIVGGEINIFRRIISQVNVREKRDYLHHPSQGINGKGRCKNCLLKSFPLFIKGSRLRKKKNLCGSRLRPQLFIIGQRQSFAKFACSKGGTFVFGECSHEDGKEGFASPLFKCLGGKAELSRWWFWCWLKVDAESLPLLFKF